MTAVAQASIEVSVDDQAPRFKAAEWGDEIGVSLGGGVTLWFASLHMYDAWCQELDRQRAALGFQQTFEAAS